MCYTWVVPVISAAVAAAGTAYGGVQSANAQRDAANAMAQQNLATSTAQNNAFSQRLAAGNQQADAQGAIPDPGEGAARNAAATIMANAQKAALGQTNSVLDTENQAATQIRGQGDAQAQTLLAGTNAPALAQAQADEEARAAALLQQSSIGRQLGPQATNPSGGGSSSTSTTGDKVTDAAIARRTAIAATNVRNYGSDIAKVASYGAPLQAITTGIQSNQTGIMPAQEAGSLLAGGSATRLAPSLLAYGQAGATGQSADQIAQARAQGQMNYAGLNYGNTSEMADLGQSDADTQAANVAGQAKQNAAYQAQLAALVGSVGNLAAGIAGRTGGGPNGTFTQLFS